MARVSTIKHEDVIMYCDKLLAGGVQPTKRMLLAQFGGTDSTIGDILRGWRTAQASITAKLGVPNKLMEQIQTFLGGTITQYIHEEISARTEEQQKNIKARDDDIERGNEAHFTLLSELQEKETIITKLQENINSAQKQLDRSFLELELSHTRIKKLEEENITLQKEKERCLERACRAEGLWEGAKISTIIEKNT